MTKIDMLNIKNNKQTINETDISILSEIPLAIILLRADGIIYYCNPMANNLLGIELINRSWMTVIQECLSNISEGGHLITLKNNKKISVATQSITQLNLQALVLSDVTDIKRESDQVHTLNSLRSINHISSILAHQLKTPLTTAFVYLSSLRKQLKDNKDTFSLIEKVGLQLNTIKSLIETELAIFKSNDIKVEKINLRKLLLELIEAYKDTFKAVNISYHAESADNNFDILGNKLSLLSGIQNIIDNAIEASHAKGEIDIKLTQEANALVIKVIDYGDGICADNIKKIEKTHFTTKKGGSGLGIPVAKAIFEAHQGTLIFSSNADCTIFSINLPKTANIK